MVVRLKLRVTSYSFDKMIKLLGNCHSLITLGLIVTSIDLGTDGNMLNMHKWHEHEFTTFFVDLVAQLPKLIALLIVIPGASQSQCIVATTTLEKIYKHKRPCFCVKITDSLDGTNPYDFPQCHYEVLANDPPPLVGGLPYHLLSQEPRY